MEETPLTTATMCEARETSNLYHTHTSQAAGKLNNSHINIPRAQTPHTRK